jgi:GT2 family glycosyltransferase
MLSGSEASWRVLVALLVYDGEEHVGPCLASLAHMKPGSHSSEVLILDDASPTPGSSDRCREMTTDLGFEYYRSPRNLGIPRNKNLAMLHAVEAGYDAVVLLNADTQVPANLISTLIRPLIEDPFVSSTTAWSNNSSVYSLPNRDPDHLVQVPGLIDWLSEELDNEFEGQATTIPSGVGFCMAMPTSAIQDVGVMDPVFDRGSSMEIDWCQRSHSMGYRSVLAPACFVYHAGSGIEEAEGSMGDGERIANTHQAIIDDRYSQYRSQLLTLLSSGTIDGIREKANGRIIICAAREKGYRLEVSRLHQNADDHDAVRFRVDPTGGVPAITATYEGFEQSFAVAEDGVLQTVENLIGKSPDEIRIFDHGRFAQDLEADAKMLAIDRVLRRTPYREQVL